LDREVRALLSFRFVAAVAGIFVLLFIVRSVTAGDEVDQVAADTSTNPVSRVINLAERLDRSTERFAVNPEGLAASTVTFTIEEQRTVIIVEGTTGVNDCTIPDLAEGNCVIFADLLGEAVVWFLLQPVVENDHVVLPAVTGFERGLAVLENGMRLAHAPAFIRRCPTEYASFTEMRTDVGNDFVSWWSLNEGELTDVVCTTR
jgi:hypothetical protein